MRNDHQRFQATETARVALLKRFVAAVEARDEQELLTLLAPDASWTADGGGRTAASPRPIVGAEQIAKLIIGLQKRFSRDQATMHLAEVNGETGLFVRLDGRIIATISIATDGDRILAGYAVVNPDKLRDGPAVS